MVTASTHDADVRHSRELDALIVRNIGDIEAAVARVTRYIDARLWTEMAAVVEENVGRFGLRSYNRPDDHDVWFAFEDATWWKDGTNPQFWFGIDEIPGPTDQTPDSWISEAVGDNAQGARLGLVFCQDVLKVRALARVIKSKSYLVELLTQTRVELHGSQNLFVGIDFDKDSMARAFEDDAFEDAMKPLAKAINTVLDQRDAFQEIVDAIISEEAQT